MDIESLRANVRKIVAEMDAITENGALPTEEQRQHYTAALLKAKYDLYKAELSGKTVDTPQGPYTFGTIE